MMASRVAAELKKDETLEVETVKGGLGEFSVDIDDQRVIDTNRLWYPSTTGVVKKVKALLHR